MCAVKLPSTLREGKLVRHSRATQPPAAVVTGRRAEALRSGTCVLTLPLEEEVLCLQITQGGGVGHVAGARR
jgi:hypothetical protein